MVGASGRTGRLLIGLALERGHEVTALVRDESHFTAPDDRLKIISGDVLSPPTLLPAVEGQDAVVSLLAPRPRTNGRVYVEGTRNLTNAAAQARVCRFVAVSAAGAGVDRQMLPFAYRMVLHIPVVAKLYPDIALMEEEIRARADVDWTVVRPPILTNGPRTGRYREAVGPVVDGGLLLSRSDLAEFLLEVVESQRFLRESVAVAL